MRLQRNPEAIPPTCWGQHETFEFDWGWCCQPLEIFPVDSCDSSQLCFAWILVCPPVCLRIWTDVHCTERMWTETGLKRHWPGTKPPAACGSAQRRVGADFCYSFSLVWMSLCFLQNQKLASAKGIEPQRLQLEPACWTSWCETVEDRSRQSSRPPAGKQSSRPSGGMRRFFLCLSAQSCPSFIRCQ